MQKDTERRALSVEAQEAFRKLRRELRPEEIEQESFQIIEKECAELAASLPIEYWRIARRLIHASAHLSLGTSLRFRGNPVAAGIRALRAQATLFCDTNMVRSGLSLLRLQKVCPQYRESDILCYTAHPDVAAKAKELGCTRAICAVEKAIEQLNGAIILIGNAPLALARVVQAILEEQIRPALLIAMPVGFVNVQESKELLSLCKDIPTIWLEGRYGGSTLAVACLHAILESAE